MKMNHLAAAVIVMTAATLPISAADAKAQALKSTFADTASCQTIEEGEDRFTLKCAVPGGGIHAILSYWDGRAFVAYEPYYKQGGKARLHAIASDASRVFGQKIEWRMQEGGQQACAAIVRIYSTKTGILAVSDLATGKLLGDASTNAQAHELADKACLSNAKASSGTASTRTDVSPVKTVVSMTVNQQSVTESALRGQKAFDDAYRMGGISSAVDEIRNCYRKLQKQSSSSSLAYCAAMDILGGNVDAMMAQGNSKLMQKYFDRGRATDERIEAGLKKLGLSRQQRGAFEKELATAIGATLRD